MTSTMKKRMSTLSTISGSSNHNEEIPINSIVKVKSTGLEGILLYVGRTEFKDGIWYGIRLFNEGQGKNDGSVNGVYYFDCPPSSGVFVLRKNLELIEAYNSPPPVNQYTPPQSPIGLKSEPISKRNSILSNGSTGNLRNKRESIISSHGATLTPSRSKRESIMSTSSSMRFKHRGSDYGLDQSRDSLTINTMQGNLSNSGSMPLSASMSLSPSSASLVAATNDQASCIVNEQSKIIQELQRELAEKERKFREIQCNIDDAKSAAKRTEIARKQCEKLEEQLKEARQQNEELKKENEGIQEELQKSKEQYKELLQDYEILVNEFENFSKETSASIAAISEMGSVADEEEEIDEDGNVIKKTVNKENVSFLLKEMQDLKDRCKKAEAKVADYERNDNTKMYPATRALLEMKEKKIQKLEKQLSELKLNKKLAASDSNATLTNISNPLNSPISTISDPSTVVSNQEYIDLRTQLNSAEDSKVALENRCYRLEKEIESWKSKVQQQNLSYWMPRESSRARLTSYKFM